jgi:hypothetical protein
MATAKNLNETDPAAPANARNAGWQVVGTPSGTDPSSGAPVYDASCYMTDMVGDTGSGGADGLVPAPPAGSAAAGKFLKADGTWEVPGSEQPASITVVIDGGSVSPGTGPYKPIVLNYAATIVGWSIIGNISGSASLDVWFIAGTGAPPDAPNVPTSSNKISGSAPITLSSAQTASGGASAISTWTLALTQWGTIILNLNSITTCHWLEVQLFLTRT